MGCANSAPETGARTLVIDGVAVIVAPLTAGTWTARTQERTKPLPQTADGTAQLRQAIEAASGCRVTDSDFSEGGRQFDAQLSCDDKTPKDSKAPKAPNALQGR